MEPVENRLNLQRLPCSATPHRAPSSSSSLPLPVLLGASPASFLQVSVMHPQYGSRMRISIQLKVEGTEPALLHAIAHLHRIGELQQKALVGENLVL